MSFIRFWTALIANVQYQNNDFIIIDSVYEPPGIEADYQLAHKGVNN